MRRIRAGNGNARLGRPGLVLAFVLLWGVGWCVGCSRLEDELIERAVERASTGPDPRWLRDDVLHVVLCGTGTPLPDPSRAAACTAILAGGKLYLVDVGPGSAENIQLWGLPRERLAGVFLTHFHSDHIGELGEVTMQSWVAGRFEPLPVHGPPGVEGVVKGFQQAYALDTRYRVAHHGPEFMPASGAVLVAREIDVSPDVDRVVLRDGELVVTAIPVDHRPAAPAVGYRFDYRGRSVVISGDTIPSQNLQEKSAGADILVHEALAADLIEKLSEGLEQAGAERLARLSGDIVDYHTTPADAVELARDAGVEMIVLTHLVPPLPNAIASLFMLRDVDQSGVEVVLGDDGMHFALPVGENTIERGTID